MTRRKIDSRPIAWVCRSWWQTANDDPHQACGQPARSPGTENRQSVDRDRIAHVNEERPTISYQRWRVDVVAGAGSWRSVSCSLLTASMIFAYARVVAARPGAGTVAGVSKSEWKYML